MQNDEYLKLYEREWEKILGKKPIEITREEREELHKLIHKDQQEGDE